MSVLPPARPGRSALLVWWPGRDRGLPTSPPGGNPRLRGTPTETLLVPRPPEEQETLAAAEREASDFERILAICTANLPTPGWAVSRWPKLPTHQAASGKPLPDRTDSACEPTAHGVHLPPATTAMCSPPCPVRRRVAFGTTTETELEGVGTRYLPLGTGVAPPLAPQLTVSNRPGEGYRMKGG